MEYEIKNNHGHWEGYINGEFYCSGDTLEEVAREIERHLYGGKE